VKSSLINSSDKINDLYDLNLMRKMIKSSSSFVIILIRLKTCLVGSLPRKVGDEVNIPLTILIHAMKILP
jgi:hypothetical protein